MLLSLSGEVGEVKSESTVWTVAVETLLDENKPGGLLEKDELEIIDSCELWNCRSFWTAGGSAGRELTPPTETVAEARLSCDKDAGLDGA